MNNIFSIKINTLFLSAILIAGAIALSSPSFTTTASAQSEPYYVDNIYGPEPREYSPEYSDSNNYNIYEQPEYGMDSYEKPSYRNDYYEQPREYPSYKPDYKSKYPSYEKDNNYKSKDSSNSVSINILKEYVYY